MEKNRQLIRWILAGGGLLTCLMLVIGVNVYGYHNIVAKAKMQENVTYFKDFSLPTADGKTFGTKDLEGYDLIVLNGWAPWCPSCIREMPELSRLAQDMKAENVLILGIVADNGKEIHTGTEAQEEYLKQSQEVISNTGVTYPNLLSDERFVSEVEGMMNGSYPGTWFILSDGTVVDFVSGTDSYDGWKKKIGEVLREQEGK